MPIQIQGNGGTVVETDGTTFRALRTTPRPTDALGHYTLGAFTGIIPAALTANSELFQFRWTDGTRLALIQSIKISAVVSTTFFAAGVPVQIDVIKSTAWSGQGTGGTAVAPAATIKKRTSYGSSLVASGDIRIATTAALGAGTKTLEANSLCAVAAPGPITASLNGLILPQTELLTPDHPLVLVASEGFSIRGVAVPATGTWTMGVQVTWAEGTAY